MMKKLIAVLIVTLILAGTSLAGPTVVFEDNFNDEPATGANLVPEDWVVAGGTVDIIGEGTGVEYFQAGHGLYIDLDGSTGQPGLLAIKDPILFQADCTYTLTFELAGSQRQADQLSETVGVGFVEVLGAFTDLFTRNWDDGFSTETIVFPGDGFLHRILFYNMYSSDNIGAILDNVKVTTISGLYWITSR